MMENHFDMFMTDSQIDEYLAQLKERRIDLELEMEDDLHPEWRCPPRE
jgi:hypothetical protein